MFCVCIVLFKIYGRPSTSLPKIIKICLSFDKVIAKIKWCSFFDLLSRKGENCDALQLEAARRRAIRYGL